MAYIKIKKQEFPKNILIFEPAAVDSVIKYINGGQKVQGFTTKEG